MVSRRLQAPGLLIIQWLWIDSRQNFIFIDEITVFTTLLRPQYRPNLYNEMLFLTAGEA